MTATVEQLKSELAELTVRERAQVAGFLLRSLDDAPDTDAEAAWDMELERRAEMIRSGTAQGEPAEQVFAELRRRFSLAPGFSRVWAGRGMETVSTVSTESRDYRQTVETVCHNYDSGHPAKAGC